MKTLIVTLGGQGCLYCKAGTDTGPCPKVRVVDTTAAGDTSAARSPRG
ncbi:MAG: PfkB family carbohydrate kinase [Candidatus Borkfalkia sp.]